MRTVNQNFAAAEKKPAHVLAVFHFAGGDVFLSDTSITPSGGPDFQGLVAGWNAPERVARWLSSISMPEIEVEVVNSGSPSFSALIESNDPENTEVELFMWFEGTQYSDKETIGKFKISPAGCSVSYDGNSVKLSLVGSFKGMDRIIGTVIGRDAWPEADPRAIGEAEKVIYGSVKNVPCPAVSAGAVSTLASDITLSQTDGIELSLAPGEMAFPPSGTLQVGDEKISYAGLSGKVLTGVSRAVDGTTAASHGRGAKVFEIKSSYDYLVAGHPVKSIGDVYVGGVRVLSGVSRAPSDGGKAKISFSEKFILEKAVDLNVSQGRHSHQDSPWSGLGTKTSATRWTASVNPNWTTNEHAGNAFVDSAGYYFYITGNGSNYIDVQSIEGRTLASGSYTGTIVRTQTETVFQDAVKGVFDAPAVGDAYALCDRSMNDFGAIIVADGYIDTVRSFLASDKGYIVGAKLCAAIGQATYNGTGRSTIQGGIFSGAFVQGGGTSMQIVKTAGTISRAQSGDVSWDDFSNMSIRAAYYSGGAAAAFFEQWVEVAYVPYNGGASPATGVALSGRSAADYVIGGEVTCDVDGWPDDASGSMTGTPGALIENPADVISHFLVNYLCMPSLEISGSFAAARASLSGAIAGGYKFAGVVDNPVNGFKFVEKLLMQSRLMFAHDGYSAKLKFLSNNLGQAAITIGMNVVPMDGLRITRTARDEIINSLDLHYQRDWTKNSKSGYLSVCSSSALYPSGGDAASVSRYGRMAPEHPFYFDFVLSGVQASDLRDFFITRYKDVKRRVEVFALLDTFGVEQGDVISFDWSSGAFSLAGAAFFVEDASVVPGSFVEKKPDLVRLIAREV